jgi:hypothetical protein
MLALAGALFMGLSSVLAQSQDKSQSDTATTDYARPEHSDTNKSIKKKMEDSKEHSEKARPGTSGTSVNPGSGRGSSDSTTDAGSGNVGHAQKDAEKSSRPASDSTVTTGSGSSDGASTSENGNTAGTTGTGPSGTSTSGTSDK